MPFLLDFELSDVRLRGHDHFWEVIRRLGKDGGLMSVKDVVVASNAHHSTVDDFMKRLVRAGILEHAGNKGEGHWAQKQFRLLDAPRETPSVRRDGTQGTYGRSRQQMWNILRGPQGREGITGADLAMLAATDDVAVNVQSAREFLKRLERAGYLTTTPKAGTAKGLIYRLKPSMNTGPQAPKLLRARIVYDPNMRAIVGGATAEEETP